MGNLLFSPSGRISPSEFMKGAIILIAIGAILQLLNLVSIKLAMGLGFTIGLVTIWCWVVLWVKRFHDASKSGWMSLVVILAWLVIAWIISLLVMPFFAGDTAQQAAEMQVAMEAATEAGDFGAIWGTAMEAAGAQAKKTAIPSAIMGIVVSGAVAYIGNMLI
ncbi:MAG TPA: DUF805 domain-containing protein, partial [Ghiorsea sp.]|nr:DUF805 domain-containing protein [Ghiorsea sp.]